MPAGNESALTRVRSAGVRAASLVDLIAVGYSRWSQDTSLSESVARSLLVEHRSLKGLAEISISDLMRATGLDEFEAIRCLALMEIGRRGAGSGKGPSVVIGGPDDVYDLLEHLRPEKREHFVAILLDAKSVVMRVANIHIGTLHESMAGARELFREAIRDGASSVIVAHNHPSGDPTPSLADISTTKHLVEVGKMLDIEVLDHVIIGERKYVSLKREGHFR